MQIFVVSNLHPDFNRNVQYHAKPANTVVKAKCTERQNYNFLSVFERNMCHNKLRMWLEKMDNGG